MIFKNDKSMDKICTNASNCHIFVEKSKKQDQARCIKALVLRKYNKKKKNI
jgi:hypothetical protein